MSICHLEGFGIGFEYVEALKANISIINYKNNKRLWKQEKLMFR